MTHRVRTRASVKIVVEVDTDAWGPDCTTEQVFKQAKEVALGKLRRELEKSRIRIVGEPVVTAVSFEEEQ